MNPTFAATIIQAAKHRSAQGSMPPRTKDVEILTLSPRALSLRYELRDIIKVSLM